MTVQVDTSIVMGKLAGFRKHENPIRFGVIPGSCGDCVHFSETEDKSISGLGKCALHTFLKATTRLNTCDLHEDIV
jgi:hypothetical protein